MEAYERVLTDAMMGDATLFAREDYVEEAWRIVDPVLKAARRSMNTNQRPGGRANAFGQTSGRLAQPGPEWSGDK